MDRLDRAVINTLQYFDIFSFPLDLEELHRFCPGKTNPTNTVATVKKLCAQGVLTHRCCFFTMNPNKNDVAFRVARYRHSKKKMPRAIRNALFIGRFPFVRGVAISGSLSKYAADENADIDFFIITEKRRLWLCRSFLHLFKKFTYIPGKQHDYCMNYFLALDELELKNKNLYTAIESTTFIPVYGEPVFQEFSKQNKWTINYLPNQKKWFANLSLHHPSGQGIKKGIEQLWAGKWGNWCDRLLQKLTTGWWRRKFRYQGFPMEYFDQDLRATSGESKYHPFDYQRKIMDSYQKKMEAFGVLNDGV